jgi:hypothetical protein
MAAPTIPEQKVRRPVQRGMRYTLKRHPDSLGAAVTDIEVDMVRPRAGSLLLCYVVAGNIGNLFLPALAATRRADDLWRHTCFEAFVRSSRDGGYYELNFAPSTQWGAYRFDGYRSGMRVATEIETPNIEVRSAPERYTLQASLNLGGWSPSTRWRLGLSAVIEEANGDKSYWALAHPPGNPDFHHSDCFAGELR